MITEKIAQELLIKKNPDMAIETCYANDKYFVCSLRHKSMPQGSATGGVCHLIDKTTGKIEICLLTDPRAFKY